MTADQEYEKLLEVWDKTETLYDLDKKIREIPLIVRAEVLKRFAETLASRNIDILNTANSKINLSRSDLDRILPHLGNQTHLRQNIAELFDEQENLTEPDFCNHKKAQLSPAEIVILSVEANSKATAQVLVDNHLFQLEHMLYNEPFSPDSYKNLFSKIPDNLKNISKEILRKNLELNIYNDKAENNFSDEKLSIIASLSPKLSKLVDFKKTLRARGSFAVAKDFLQAKENDSLHGITSFILHLDKQTLDTAQKATELDIETDNIIEAQSEIVSKLFLNSSIDQYAFERQLVNINSFYDQIKSYPLSENFVIKSKLANPNFKDELVPSNNNVEIMFQINDNKIAEIKHRELCDDTLKQENIPFDIPKLDSDAKINRQIEKIEDTQPKKRGKRALGSFPYKDI